VAMERAVWGRGPTIISPQVSKAAGFLHLFLCGKIGTFQKTHIKMELFLRKTPGSNICRAATTEVDVPGYMREQKLVLEAGRDS
jgi:hypothetical protein